MKTPIMLPLTLLFLTGMAVTSVGAQQTLDATMIRDKIRGAWLGDLVGGTYGDHYEFNPKYKGRFVREDEVPPWLKSDGSLNYNINFDFGKDGDQIWMNLPFLQSLQKAGYNAGWDDFGAGLRDSTFSDADLYSANLAARKSLRAGMKAPVTGFYTKTKGNSENQTWQMESNWTGLISPGQPHHAIDLSWRAGHVALYGEAVNGGCAVGAMTATAFTAKNVREIVEAGREAVPPDSDYRRMVDDVIRWHDEDPKRTWEQTWQLVQNKWGMVQRLKPGDVMNINVKINGAYIFMSLLYGGGDFEKSIRLCLRGGQDGDCTTSNVGAILGAFYGWNKLEEKFKKGLDTRAVFLTTAVTFDGFVDLTYTMAREQLLGTGGSIVTSGGVEQWIIPVSLPIVPPLRERWPLDTEKKDPPSLEAEAGTPSGLTVKFKAKGGESAKNYQWYFGDLTHQDGAEVEHTYLKPGNYEAIAYVNDAIGNTSYKVVKVTVKEVTVKDGESPRL